MKSTVYLLLAIALVSCKSNEQSTTLKTDSASYHEPFRPQLHFSPPRMWMNDPNGLVFFNHEYHLFYQHHPDSKVWGPMHWGHAVSKDLVHWENLPIALYPDSLGLIFSGSAVFDARNTSGFGSKEKPPLVAMFSYHSMEKEKAGRTDYQNQGVAFSVDNGRSWTKYEHNPVLKNQGIKDFRDPKVFWNEKLNQWTVILAVLDHVELWSSPDFKAWTKLSEFGRDFGSHGGVWECPDLFALKDASAIEKWVMLVSINPGGPNGGSATQYFVGDFDGKTFKPDLGKDVATWIDHGPDDYAGVTWSNVPDGRKIFLGWMSNWAYAQEVPTDPWRSAMTLPRDISLKKAGDRYFVQSALTHEFLERSKAKFDYPAFTFADSVSFKQKQFASVDLSAVSFSIDAKDFSIVLKNDQEQQLVFGYETSSNRFFLERGRSGKSDFSKNYITRAYADRYGKSSTINVTVVIDVSSVEIFFDDGLNVMTALYFADATFSDIVLKSADKTNVGTVSINKFESIW